MICAFSQPHYPVKALEFLGLVNFYIILYLTFSCPLTQSYQTTLKLCTGVILLLLPSTVSRDTMANASLLSHPEPDALTCIMTDAFDVVVGAVFQQYMDSQWRPISS